LCLVLYFFCTAGQIWAAESEEICRLVYAFSDEIRFVDANHPEFFFWGEVDNRTLNLSASLKSPDGTRSKLVGAEVLNKVVKHFEGKFDTITGRWSHRVFPSDNLYQFNQLTFDGVSLEEAATKTWTGQQAARLGFPRVEKIIAVGIDGDFSNVVVTYGKPISPPRPPEVIKMRGRHPIGP